MSMLSGLRGDRSLVREWPGMRSEYAWLPRHGGETVTGAGQVGISFSAHRHVGFGVDGRWRRASYAEGALVVSGESEIVWGDVAECTEALEMYLDAELLGALSGRPPMPLGAFVDEPVVGARDGVVLAVASRVRQAQLAGSSLGDVEASTLAHLLARRVLSRYGHLRPDLAAAGSPTLEDRPLATVTDLVESDVGARLTLDGLAATVHFSPFHFARAFKATTGITPHQFVTARRMARAWTLVSGTHLPVEVVARRVGFDNVSHFRRVFRAHHGALPSEVRRAVSSSRLGPGPARRVIAVRSRS